MSAGRRPSARSALPSSSSSKTALTAPSASLVVARPARASRSPAFKEAQSVFARGTAPVYPRLPPPFRSLCRGHVPFGGDVPIASDTMPPVTALRVDLAVPAQLLVLIGGGECSFGETREIDEFLLRSMPADRRTVAFIPAASGSAEYAGHFGKYLHGIDATVETVNVPIYRGRDSRRQKNLTQLLSAGMIYLGGGVTNNLLAVLRESAADLAMREAAANGVVIAAIGAAASCFGIAARDMHGIAASLPALGWIANTVVDTAFDPDNDANLRRLMSVPDTQLGIGIPPGTGLAIRADGSTEIVGGGNVAAFRKAQAR